MASVICLLLLFACSQQKKVTIYRDTWGVPHIYASSDFDLVFGMGHAQAEDRIEQLMINFRWATGRMAEVMGADYFEHDVQQRMWKHEKVAKENFANLNPNMQKMLKYFVAGINQFLNDHPEKKPDFAIDIQPWHPIALGRAFIWGWPLGQAIDDYNHGVNKVYDPKGSNQWAVSGKRTKSGSPILLIDPHLSWHQDGHWFEVRLHGDKIHSCGMCVPGTPFVSLGHNRNLAWAATTGGPDCGDCYEEILNPDNPQQYLYNGEWKTLKVDTVFINVKTKNGQETRERIIERTNHGPVYKKKNKIAYVLALPYENEFLLIEQMLAMNLAQNVDEFKSALAMQQFMPQNIMIADNSGDIYYQRTGMVPIRDSSFDWTKPVPGWKTDTDWKGMHDTGDLVQLLNPDQGFMQNCNISPGTMLPNSPMVLSKYPSYIYNDRTDRANSRGIRAVELLNADSDINFKEAQAIAVDCKIPQLEKLQNVLKNAFENFPQFVDIKKQVQQIANWDGELKKESKEAFLFADWFNRVKSVEGINPYDLENVVFDSDKQIKLLEHVRNAKKAMFSFFAKDTITWGETLVLTRGEKTFPLDGGSIAGGYSSLRSVWGNSKDGVTTGNGGQSGPMVIELTRPIKSASIVPWGQSDDPDSQHYFDQGEKLFQHKKFKPTWFEWDDLKNNIEQKLELHPAG